MWLAKAEVGEGSGEDHKGEGKVTAIMVEEVIDARQGEEKGEERERAEEGEGREGLQQETWSNTKRREEQRSERGGAARARGGSHTHKALSPSHSPSQH